MPSNAPDSAASAKLRTIPSASGSLSGDGPSLPDGETSEPLMFPLSSRLQAAGLRAMTSGAGLICSSAVSLARISPSPASAPGSVASDPASSGRSSASQRTCGRRACFLRMCRGFCPPQAAKMSI